MPHDSVPSQFNLRHMLLCVFIAGLLLSAIRTGLTLQGYLLIGSYVIVLGLVWRAFCRLSERGRRRARIGIAVFATVVGVSPLFVAYGFTLPGAAEPLERTNSIAIEWLLAPFYRVGEVVLGAVDIVLFMFLDGTPLIRRGGRIRSVRPDAVCFVWLAIAAWLWSSLLIECVRGRIARGNATHSDLPSDQAA